MQYYIYYIMISIQDYIYYIMCASKYVISFDRAQFFTETRAKIVDGQLCMDYFNV